MTVLHNIITPTTRYRIIQFGYIAKVSLGTLSSLPDLCLHVAIIVAMPREVHDADPVDGPRVPILLLGLGLRVAAEEGIHPLRGCGLPSRSASAPSLVTLSRDIAVVGVIIPLLILDGCLLPLGVSLVIILVPLEAEVKTRGLARSFDLGIVRTARLT